MPQESQRQQDLKEGFHDEACAAGLLPPGAQDARRGKQI
jgi:hypothetical protein